MVVVEVEVVVGVEVEVVVEVEVEVVVEVVVVVGVVLGPWRHPTAPFQSLPYVMYHPDHKRGCNPPPKGITGPSR